ncbi:hydroxyisourate hydrolase [Uliginosibacterium sp. H3]|uniref:hydroxyisourate hydrolase n=1 Tax=Uliginosibacterium silvisoli TaxID=3114758 RepID=A0ABU6K2V7_9RHOO|nr:hydroxyisourate hydrolase [Uliginosibacterium sp. H3]
MSKEIIGQDLVELPTAADETGAPDEQRRRFMFRDLLDDVRMDRRGFLGASMAMGAFGAMAGFAPDAEAQTPGAPGQLTCHVLDTYSGRPGGGMRVDLSVPDGSGWKVVKSTVTTDTGRPLEPLMSGDTLVPGNYMVEFFHADYFKARAYLPTPAFFDRVVHFFNVPAKTTRYHLTLVTAPWGYTTYRWKE